MQYKSVRLGDVKPNPFRNIDNYSLEESRIQALMDSIERTGFWSNVIGRMHGNDFQIAYGHHRLQAAINVFGADHIQDFPLADIPDYKMLQVMALENSEDWGNTTAHNNLTVSAARDMIDEFCDEYPTWEEALKGNLHGIDGNTLKEWFGDGQSPKGGAPMPKANYENCVKNGAGRNIIRKFLAWTDTKVRYALEEIPQSNKQLKVALAKAAKLKREEARTERKLAKVRKARARAESEAAATRAKAEEQRIQAELDEAEEQRMKLELDIKSKKIYDTKAGEVFDKPVHARAFRKLVTTDKMAELLPKRSQVKFAKTIKKRLTDSHISVPAIEAAGNSILEEQVGKKVVDSYKAKQTEINPLAGYVATAHSVNRYARSLKSVVNQLGSNMERDGIESFNGMAANQLDQSLRGAMQSILQFYAKFGIEPPVISRATYAGKSGFTYTVSGTSNEQPIYPNMEENAA